MEQHQEVVRRIRAFVESKFSLARSRKISNDYALLENGVVDSLGVLDLVAFIEEEFHLTVADDDLVPDNFQSIERIASFVRARTKGLAA
jgi:acyl carrier protein